MAILYDFDSGGKFDPDYHAMASRTPTLGERLLGWAILGVWALFMAIALLGGFEEWGTWDGPQGQLITTQDGRDGR